MEIIGSLALIVGAVYLLAIITDSFFIVSLDRISRELNLSDEVAGASLMAMGSSAPELFIALMALFSEGGTHSDVGIGTIVGSAVFNILVITGVSAVVAGGLRIHMFAVRRDTFYYLGAIAYLAIVFIDGNITLLEAGVGLVAYAVYVLLLAKWKAPEIPEEEREQKVTESEPYPAKTDNLFRKVEAVIVRLIKMVTGAPNENYIWTFFVAIVFIILLSYVLVEATIVFSAGIGIPPIIVALTLLAAGTSAPDLIASMEVAREGRGGMAVANAIGSDIFDVFIGLGLPWFITLIAIRPDIHVAADGLWISIAILVGTTLVLYYFLHTARTLSRREGIILLLLYAAFVVYTIVSGTSTPPA